MTENRFWESKALEELNGDEWEALCDGCARCCLHKLEDADSGEIAYTDVACRLLNLGSCRCTRYTERKRLVPDCIDVTPERLRQLGWLPPTCAYRLVAEGKPLPWWHHLVSGDPDTVHRAGISVRGRAVTERRAGELEARIVDWPGE